MSTVPMVTCAFPGCSNEFPEHYLLTVCGEKRHMLWVVSSARKLILRPQKDAPAVSFPEGAVVNEWGVDNETPSVVVRNGTEEVPSWQGVSYDKGVVIVNEVPEQTANAVLDILERGGTVQDAVDFLVEEGCADQYTTSLDFVEGKLSPAGRMLSPTTGVVKRDDRDLTPCWREGDTFFVSHKDEGRVIEPDILKRTYRNPDGTPINLAAIPHGPPENINN